MCLINHIWCLGCTSCDRMWIHVSSRQNLHLSSCYCYGHIAVGGPVSLPGFCGMFAFSRSNFWSQNHQNPFLNRLGNGLSSCFVAFRCFGNTSCSFRVACICMHVPSFSFHLHASSDCAFISFCFPFMFLSLVFMSIHFPFIFLSVSFQCAFMSSHLPFICTDVPFILHSCPFMFFLKLWKWLYGLAREPSATHGYRWVIAKVIAKLLNNPSNIWHCSKEICHNTTERERER